MRLPLLRILAWSLLVAVAFATLSPIGLRPNSGLSPGVERVAAFLAIGLAFALAYPRHIWLVVAIVGGAAVGFELLQLTVPSRHGRWIDLGAKLAGGGIGIGVGWVLSRLRTRRPPG